MYFGDQSDMERKENRIIKEAQRLRKPSYSTESKNWFWKKSDLNFKHANFEVMERHPGGYVHLTESQKCKTKAPKRSEVQLGEP